MENISGVRQRVLRHEGDDLNKGSSSAKAAQGAKPHGPDHYDRFNALDADLSSQETSAPQTEQTAPAPDQVAQQPATTWRDRVTGVQGDEDIKPFLDGQSLMEEEVDRVNGDINMRAASAHADPNMRLQLQGQAALMQLRNYDMEEVAEKKVLIGELEKRLQMAQEELDTAVADKSADPGLVADLKKNADMAASELERARGTLRNAEQLLAQRQQQVEANQKIAVQMLKGQTPIVPFMAEQIVGNRPQQVSTLEAAMRFVARHKFFLTVIAVSAPITLHLAWLADNGEIPLAHSVKMNVLAVLTLLLAAAADFLNPRNGMHQ